MWENVGLVRNNESMKEAIKDLSELYPYIWKENETISDFETVNMWTTAMLVTRSALWRKESRGSHYRSDYPSEDNQYLVSDIIRR
jgi:succinate dehydrogenase/fumarate reductase flavoprotein subunit